MSKTYSFIGPPDPALSPPPGIIPDFQDPYTLRPYHTMTASFCLVLTSFFVIARLYTKQFIMKKSLWEDYTCVFAYIFFAAYIGLEFVVIDAKGGTHQWNVTTREVTRQRKFSNYIDILFSPCMLFTKLSIILLVLRVFCPRTYPRTRDPFYWILQGLNALNTVFYTIFFFLSIFGCAPRQKIWFPDAPGHCIQAFDAYIASAAFNAASDMAMLFVPLWKVWHLRISKSRKIGISAVLLTGCLAIVSSIVRLIFTVFLSSSDDYSYGKVRTMLWSYGELGFGIICSCLFVLPRLYLHLASISPYASDAQGNRRHKSSLSLVHHQQNSNRLLNNPAVPTRTWESQTPKDGKTWLQLDSGRSVSNPSDEIGFGSNLQDMRPRK